MKSNKQTPSMEQKYWNIGLVISIIGAVGIIFTTPVKFTFDWFLIGIVLGISCCELINYYIKKEEAGK